MSHTPKSNIQAIYPLSPMQRGILFNAIRDTGADPYFMQLHVGLEGPLNAELFHQAWLQVVARHGVFRTLFVYENRDVPLQLVQAKVNLPWESLDWRTLGKEDHSRRLEAFLTEDRRKGMSLDRAPLMRMTLIRTGDQSHFFVWSTHHILLDAWCKKLVLNEVAAIYQKLIAGQPLNLAPAAPYKNYIKWLNQQDLEAAKQFWREGLSGFDRATLLPREREVQGRSVSGQYGLRSLNLNEGQTQSLSQLARAHRVTVSAMVQACWAATLHSFCGSDDLLFGVTISGRPESLQGVESMIGLFINTLPLRIAFHHGSSLLAWLEELQTRQMALTRFGYSPLYEIQNWCGRHAQTPLFDSILIFQNYPRDSPQDHPDVPVADGGLSLVKIEVTGRANYPISLTASLRSDLALQLNYDTEQFSEDVIDLMISRMARLLMHMAQGLDQSVDSWLEAACFANQASHQLRPALESILVREPDVSEAAVGFLEDRKGTLWAIAYVVPDGPLEAARLLTSLQAKDHPATASLGAVVPVTSLPLTKTGQIDMAKLRQIPIPDRSAVENLMAQIGQRDSVLDYAILRQPRKDGWQRFHLKKVLPETLQPDRSPSQALSEASGAIPEAEAPRRPPAVAGGGPLIIEEGEAATLTQAFQQTARDHGEQAIIHVSNYGKEHVQTYETLYQDACKMLGGLQASGLKPGNSVLLQINDSPLYFTTFWACLLGGFQPVTVAIPPSYHEDHAINQKIHKAWVLIGAPTILASKSLVGPLDALRHRFEMDGFSVLDVDELVQASPSTRFYDARPEDTAFLQLTSGSTGTPKCIPETHRAIVAHVLGSKRHNAYVPGDRFMNWMPMDHIGSILKYHIGVLYSGYTQVHASPDLIIADPLKWLDLMEKHRITHSWSPNFGFKLVVTQLLKNPDRSWDLSHLKFLLNAGEQVTMPVLRDFTRLLAPFGITPKVFQPAFGMAETCTGITYQTDFNFEQGIRSVNERPMFEPLTFLPPGGADASPSATHFVSLGPPMPGVTICITDDKQSPLSEGVIGHFHVRGDMVLKGYLNNPAANRESFTEDGWFKTGDLGFILNKHLFITGREKEMIVINGANYYCYEIEEQVNQVPGVQPTFAAATSVNATSNDGEELAVFFVASDGIPDRGFGLIEAIRTKLAKGIGLPARHIIPLAMDDFPKTTSGKIQRNQLRKSLEDGIYQSLQREIDLFLGNANTLPNWFYQPTWRLDQHRPLSDVSETTLLCFCDQDAQALALANAGHRFGRLVTVTVAEAFARLGDNHFTCDPTRAGQAASLFDALDQVGITIHKIACFWNLGQVPLEKRLAFWLPLLQVLAKRPNGPALHLQAVTLLAREVKPGECPDPDAMALVSLLKTAAIEIPHLETSSLDLDEASLANTGLLLDELACFQKKDIALRADRRYTMTLDNLDLAQSSPSSFPIEPGAMILITGGLGGIGQLLAEALIERFDARLLLIGRTNLDTLDHPTEGDEGHPLLHAWQKLRASGTRLAYAAVDVCDSAALKKTIEAHEETWSCRLAGVFHLAGVAEECSLEKENLAHFLTSIAAKVAGTRALHAALKNRPQAFLHAFSSVNGHFGGNRYGAYATACGFLDGFAAWRIAQGFSNTKTLAWTQWADCGMSQGFQLAHVAEARGFPPLTEAEALTTCWIAMSQKPSLQLLGIDHGKSYVASHVNRATQTLDHLVGYFVAHPGKALRIDSIYGLNRFATPVPCEWHRVETIARNHLGQVDEASLQAVSLKDSGRRPYAAPRNELEKQLAALWKELLGVPKVGIHDNYFELGGHSINATQLLLRLRSTLNVDLPLQSLFDKPTIAEIANLLSPETESELTRDGKDQTPEFHKDLSLADTITASSQLQKMTHPPKRILLTGATGFVGAFLLETLLGETSAEVWCLVRAGNEEEATKRLKERLNHYRVSLENSAFRVHSLAGDLGKPLLGLTQNTWDKLAGQIDAVYHNGAQVNFVLPYAKLRAPNVLGTAEILRFAASTQLKPVHFVSTLSAIPAMYHASEPFPEDGDPHGEPGELNGYERTKWVAESLMRKAMAQGVPGTILRLGRISGHSEHGASAETDMIIRLIQGSVMAGILPRIPLSLQMLPVDFACRAMLALTRNQDFLGRTFHLFNPHGATLDMLREAALDVGIPLQEVTAELWHKRLTEQAEASPNHPLFPLFNQLQQMASGGSEKAKQHQPYDQRQTQAALAQMGIKLPAIGKDLLGTYFQYLQNSGLLAERAFPQNQRAMP